MEKKYNIEVIISDVQVDEEYYAFDYEIKVNGKKNARGNYEGDYENGKTPKQQKKMLLDGEALNLALQQFVEEDY